MSLASKNSEVKYARSDRRILCGAHAAHRAVCRAFHRAARRAARLACKVAS
jgi:hypothetical protein